MFGHLCVNISVFAQMRTGELGFDSGFGFAGLDLLDGGHLGTARAGSCTALIAGLGWLPASLFGSDGSARCARVFVLVATILGLASLGVGDGKIGWVAQCLFQLPQLPSHTAWSRLLLSIRYDMLGYEVISGCEHAYARLRRFFQRQR